MTSEQTLPALMTVAEVAAFIRVHRSTVDRLVREGKFPAPTKFGGAVQRFSRDAVLQFLSASQTAEPLEARQRKAARKRRKAKR